MNDNNGNEDEDNQRQQQLLVAAAADAADVEQEQEQAAMDNDDDAAAAAAVAIEQRLLTLISIVQRKKEFPFLLRNCIDENVEEFLDITENNFHEILATDADAGAEQEQEQAAMEDTAAAGATDAIEQSRLKFISILQRKRAFPFLLRNCIDENVEVILDIIENSFHEIFCGLYYDPNSDDEDRRLDSDRDTNKEVEIALGFFPGVMTRRVGYRYRYPIEFLCRWCHNKNVSFIPTVAKVAIEHVLFDDEERGGLLYTNLDGLNALQSFMGSHNSKRQQDNREYYELIDTKYLQVMIQLRRMNLLKKEDIQQYNLLNILCYIAPYYFPEQRFKHLVEWDPNALTQTDINGDLPLHDAARGNFRYAFQSVFEYGLHYYPQKKGLQLLFRKNDDGVTPIQLACRRFGRDQTMKIIEAVRVRHSGYGDTPSSSFNIMNGLITASIEESVHIDGVYYLLRREPDIIQKLLLSGDSRNRNSSTTMTTNKDNSINPKKRKKSE